MEILRVWDGSKLSSLKKKGAFFFQQIPYREHVHGWTEPLGVSACVLLLLHLFHAALSAPLVDLVHLMQNKH